MTATTLHPPVVHHPDFLSPEESRAWLDRSRQLAWARDTIIMYGRHIPVPREECLYGDDLRYQYRGTIIKALPWPGFLVEMRDSIENLSGHRFNFTVGNLYLSGRDSIGWHADDFPQIGIRPAIASLSLIITGSNDTTNQSIVNVSAARESQVIIPSCDESDSHIQVRLASEGSWPRSKMPASVMDLIQRKAVVVGTAAAMHRLDADTFRPSRRATTRSRSISHAGSDKNSCGKCRLRSCRRLIIRRTKRASTTMRDDDLLLLSAKSSRARAICAASIESDVMSALSIGPSFGSLFMRDMHAEELGELLQVRRQQRQHHSQPSEA